MDPAVIAARLRELAIYYELDGDRHRAFAYDRAAKSVGAANGLHRLLDEGRLEELPGIGPSIARAVGELARRGNLEVLDRMRAKWPPVVIELCELPKIGITKARALYQALQPADLDTVAALCRAHAVRSIKGFGATSEDAILAAIEDRRRTGVRDILVDALPHAELVLAQLRAFGFTAEHAGPVRRWSEIVDHFAYAVVLDAEAQRGYLADKLAEMVTLDDRDAIGGRLATGMRVLVVAAPRAHYGWALIRATGSPEHVAMLEARAADRGVALATLVAPDEASVYAALGLPMLPPEVRDGTDELVAADAGDTFLDLVTLGDLRTATHCHTTYSDGKHSIAEMTAAAAERGFAAITITDHSAAASYAGGLDRDALLAQAAEIRGLVDPPARIFRGTEADILADGAIDVPPQLLGGLDLVIASVHQRFQLDEDAMTARLVAAMRQPFYKIWGHALGRLVMRRDPIKLRIDDVLDAAAESRAAIEINGDPHRLDLDPVNARRAAARGIKFVLSCDAHSVRNLDYMRYAVAMARRARIRTRDVLNALPPDEFAAIVRPTDSAA